MWGKKIEKQIHEGRDLKELGPEAERRRHEERLVSRTCSPCCISTWTSTARKHRLTQRCFLTGIMLQLEIEKVRKRREEYAAQKEQMEEEKAVIDRERAIAEGRDAEAKEEEVWSCWCL